MVSTARNLCEQKIDPFVGDWVEQGHIDDLRALTKELGNVGLLGMHREGYGCAGMSATEYGLDCLELEASDPASGRWSRRRARRDRDDWILDGTKTWIPNGSAADVAIVWAQTDDGARGFVVPTDTPGFSAPKSRHKMSLRASVTSELVLDGVRPRRSAEPGVAW